jgi:hypothetical protein
MKYFKGSGGSLIDIVTNLINGLPDNGSVDSPTSNNGNWVLCDLLLGYETI